MKTNCCYSEKTAFLTPTDLLQYLYCPRFTYFFYCLSIPEHQEKRFKVQKGRLVHEAKSSINKEYLRKKIGVEKKESEVYLSSEKYHLKGIVDEVLYLSNGKMAPLDFKFAEYKEKRFKTYKNQSLCYALLIEDNYGKPAPKGYIVYTRSRNKLIEIEFTEKDKKELVNSINEILLILHKGYFPKKTSSKAKCADCTYRNICV